MTFPRRASGADPKPFDPVDLPDGFQQWLVKYLEANPPALLAGDIIGAVRTGTIVDSDIRSTAAIGIDKLAGYPADATKVLTGDGTWAVASSAPRIITGQITSAGGITAGTGFTAAKNGTGDYTITFTTAFTTAAVVSGQALAGNNARVFVVDGTVTSSARIYIFDLAGTHQDATFFFVATQVQ